MHSLACIVVMQVLLICARHLKEPRTNNVVNSRDNTGTFLYRFRSRDIYIEMPPEERPLLRLTRMR
jgi:hypothetical protein